MTPAAAIRAALGDEVRDCLRVVVTGSREWTAGGPVRDALTACVERCRSIVVGHGAAKGLDMIVAGCAATIATGYGNDSYVQSYPADWTTNGRSAGPLRNQRMLDSVRPDIVLAFPLPSSTGTWDCVRRALAMRVPVAVVYVDGSAEVRRG